MNLFCRFGRHMWSYRRTISRMAGLPFGCVLMTTTRYCERCERIEESVDLPEAPYYTWEEKRTI